MSSSSQSPIPLTVIMRCYNDAPVLPRVLRNLREQEGVDLTVWAYDNESTDGSRQMLVDYGVDRLTDIPTGHYHSSTLLNGAMAEVPTEIAIFLNSDGVLESPHVLRWLAEAVLADDRCGAAFPRQTVRPDASMMTKLDYFHAFDRRWRLKEAANWLSLVCTAMRVAAWREIPFDKRLTYAEDAVWSQVAAQKNWKVSYVHKAPVEHSHEYTRAQVYRRAFGDASALQAVQGPRVPRDAWNGYIKPMVRRFLRDSLTLLEMGKPWHIPFLPGYRRPWIKGHWHGSVAGQVHFTGPNKDKPQLRMARSI